MNTTTFQEKTEQWLTWPSSAHRRFLYLKWKHHVRSNHKAKKRKRHTPEPGPPMIKITGFAAAGAIVRSFPRCCCWPKLWWGQCDETERREWLVLEFTEYSVSAVVSHSEDKLGVPRKGEDCCWQLPLNKITSRRDERRRGSFPWEGKTLSQASIRTLSSARQSTLQADTQSKSSQPKVFSRIINTTKSVQFAGESSHTQPDTAAGKWKEKKKSCTN